ncbi:hypothetical protein V6N12_064823 [Hibiscus sabdariffa]|uniref:RNase H type-1 domain-containing protein n=1 Tax=Hibiscus sabdariffa TaxID=183260 RepID=A0ABR2G6V4_9ROSI
MAELWGIFIGLQVAWSNGFEYIQVQSDNSQAIKLINDESRDRSRLYLVHVISSLLARAWRTDCFWIPRSCNIVADAISRISSSRSPHLSILHAAPLSIAQAIADDSAVLQASMAEIT